jgi:trimeric autotransporter adhesin
MNRRRSVWLLFAVLAGVAGCRIGPSVDFGSAPLPPADPSISGISPTSVTAGSAPFTLTVNGANFGSGASILWSNPGNPDFRGGTATLVSATQLTLQISAADVAIPGTVQVSVLVPNGSAASNAVTFTISQSGAGGAQQVSLGANGATPNGNSSDPVLSFNGRFVAFASEATNLIAGGTNFAEAYLRDTCLGADNCTPSTLLASAETGGSGASPMEGNGLGGATPSITFQGNATSQGAGRFVGFLSTATNLVTSPAVSRQQAYFRDTCPVASPGGCTPATLLVSATQAGNEPNGAATEFIMSSKACDGAFVSSGTDVLSGVSTPNEVYLSVCGVSPLAFGFTTSALVSASSLGTPGDQGGQQPAISADGRFVAFASTSTNLTSTPNGGTQQIYLRDTCQLAGSGCAPSTTIVSVDSSGNAIAGSSQVPAISDDGRFVAFSTFQALPGGGGNTSVVYLYDRCNSSSGPVTSCASSTTTVSIAANGGIANGPSNSGRHAVSGDGRLVVFSSSATNLISGGNPAAQVFVRDTCKSSSGTISGCTPKTVLLSTGSAGATGGFNAAISNDGHFVSYQAAVGSVQQIFVAATGF